MARDFTAAVAKLIASAPIDREDVNRTKPVTVIQPLPGPTLANALSGDPLAQAQMALDIMAANQSSSKADHIELAEDWARKSAASGCHAGFYQLAHVLLFRAGVLHGVGFTKLARADAAEGLDLLNELADLGYERAADDIIHTTDALAEVGLCVRETR